MTVSSQRQGITVGHHLSPKGVTLSPNGAAFRTLHTTPSFAASGIKEFVPKWMRRSKEEEEITPDEYLGMATKDALTASRKPSDKFLGEYHPPANLADTIASLSQQFLPSFSSSSAFPDAASKFAFLDACVEAFGKRIPNSFLDDLKTVDDALAFFSTPTLARDRVLERLRDDVTTPPNVHVTPEYLTYEKEMELHEGRDVYPHQDIIVSSLREKGKYKSVRKPKCPWEEAQGFDLPVRRGRHKGF